MNINPQQAYKHYKGEIYFVLYENVIHTETREKLIVYTDGNGIYARPYEMFHGFTSDGVKRFSKISYSSNS